MSDSLKVEQQVDGTWSVLDGNQVVLASGLSNSAAWREAERYTKQPNWKTSKNQFRSRRLNLRVCNKHD